MANDLAIIVRNTEDSLARQPTQYSTQLELFVSQDEKILSEFLINEKAEKPHYLRYKDWKLLVGSPEMYLKPKRFMEKARREFQAAVNVVQGIAEDLTDVELEEGYLQSEPVQRLVSLAQGS